MTTPTQTLRALLAASLILAQFPVSAAAQGNARAMRPAAAPGQIVLRLGPGVARVNVTAAVFSGANLGIDAAKLALPSSFLRLSINAQSKNPGPEDGYGKPEPKPQDPLAPEPGVSVKAVAAKPILAAAKTAPKTLVGRLQSALVAKDSERAVATQFDGSATASASFFAPVSVSASGAAFGAMGLRPLPAPVLPQGGVVLEDAPASPDPKQSGGVSINTMDLPGARGVGGIFDAGPVRLNADPNNALAVRDALLAVVDADAARYGVTSAELSTVHSVRVGNAIFTVFKQQKTSANPDGTSVKVDVDGARLSFTTIVRDDGRPYLMAAMAKLYPNIPVATASRYSEADLQALAERQLPQNAGITLSLVERRVIFRKTTQSWHTANLYDIDGLPQAVGVRVAVDVNTGDVFAWDARHGATDGTAPAASASGKVDGTAEMSDTRPNGEAVLSQVPLPNLTLTLSNGKTVTTDENGRFKAELPDGQPQNVTGTLSGTYTTINDRANSPVKISATITAAGPNEFVVTATATDEVKRSQLNVYVNINRVVQWVTKRIGREQRILKHIPANVNINQECNAYYDRRSLNFFKSSKNCSDTSKPGVVMHEWGHFFDDMIGGITNGGLSEGWGDILSMYILGSPIIGDGFLRTRTPSWIRHGENDYQYGENDEVHDQGQAWMGFAWQLRKRLIAKLGEAAGAAAAEALVIPTIYAKASDIPSAIAQVLLNGMGGDGKIAHEAEIRDAAKHHGITLPAAPGGFGAAVAAAGSAVVNSIAGRSSSGQAEVQALGVVAGESAEGFVAAEFLDAPEAGTRQDETMGPQTPVRGKLSFSAGALLRGRARNAIRRHLDFAGLVEGRDYELKEYKGWLNSDFLLTVNGPQEEVVYHLEQVKRLLRNLADN